MPPQTEAHTETLLLWIFQIRYHHWLVNLLNALVVPSHTNSINSCHQWTKFGTRLEAYIAHLTQIKLNTHTYKIKQVVVQAINGLRSHRWAKNDANKPLLPGINDVVWMWQVGSSLWCPFSTSNQPTQDHIKCKVWPIAFNLPPYFIFHYTDS